MRFQSAFKFGVNYATTLLKSEVKLKLFRTTKHCAAIVSCLDSESNHFDEQRGREASRRPTSARLICRGFLL